MQPGIFCKLKYETDIILDKSLNICLKSGIKNVRIYSENTYMNIEFCNDVKANFWYLGKYQTWLYKGKIGEYSYENAQPKKKTMRKLVKALVEYYAKKCENGI